MLCQKCSQAEATVHLTSLALAGKLGSASEAHLCAKCAAGAGLPTAADIAKLHPCAAALHEMLQQAIGAQLPGQVPQRKCPHCGMTLDDFRRTGRLGCPRDYEVFPEIAGLAEHVHGGARHVGKIPPNAPPEVRLAVLGARADHIRGRLKAAVLREEYELAAELRDQLAAAEAEARRLGEAGAGGGAG